MNITIVSAGSQGDIQPYLALAVGLKNAGYRVRFAANSNFADFVTAYGVEFLPIKVDSFKIAQSPEGKAWLESDSILQLILTTGRVVKPVTRQIAADALEACRGSEAIIYHAFALPFTYFIGKQLNIPCIPAAIDPLPSGAHPALPLNIKWKRSRTFNLLTHALVDHFVWQVYSSLIREAWKGKVNLPAVNPYRQILKERGLIVSGYSRSFLPQPADLPDHVELTGYWFLDPPPRWIPDPALVDFIESRQRPIYIGFGSMGNSDKKDSTAGMVFDALAETKQRAVLGAGWSDMGAGQRLPDNVFVLKSIPHRWLFPRMSAIVHHAGPGTTAEALSSGVPSVTVPHFASQYFYADHLAEQGVSPTPIPRRRLSTQRLAEAISVALTDQTMRTKAGLLGAKIRSEDGVGNAVRAIQGFLNPRNSNT
jgi:UDP:flavonoid glycosyltransferase YjiC (YdhE family)